MVPVRRIVFTMGSFQGSREVPIPPRNARSGASRRSPTRSSMDRIMNRCICQVASSPGLTSRDLPGREIRAAAPSTSKDASSTPFLAGQVLVDQPHRHRALAHRGGATLDRARARVARREYSWHALLQQERLPRTFPPIFLIEYGAVQRRPRQDETTFVEPNGSPEPDGV